MISPRNIRHAAPSHPARRTPYRRAVRSSQVITDSLILLTRKLLWDTFFRLLHYPAKRLAGLYALRGKCYTLPHRGMPGPARAARAGCAGAGGGRSSAIRCGVKSCAYNFRGEIVGEVVKRSWVGRQNASVGHGEGMRGGIQVWGFERGNSSARYGNRVSPLAAFFSSFFAPWAH
jgi:hypothetical protein